MAKGRGNSDESDQIRHRAATTPLARENQLINLAVDLAERQLRDGTASAQIISHYLKASSSREYLEQQRIAMDIELMEAKKNQMAQADRMEMLIENATNAMRGYSGVEPIDKGDPYDD